jgi:F-type H+-transporting ATPase subunit b
LNQEIIRWTQKQVFAITRKALADLAGASLEERMTDVFVQRLGALNGAAKEQLAAALKSSTSSARVRSAFDLPPAQQATIQKALNETFSADIHIQFETAPELASGIELSANGQKVAWSISDYLTTLEKSAGELLHAETKPDPKPEAKAPAKTDTKVAAKSWQKREAKPSLEPVASAPKANH